MKLKIKVNKGTKRTPERTVFTAPEGTGKSTFAAGAPGVVFLDLESSTGELDVPRLEYEDDTGAMRAPGNYAEVLQFMEYLQTEDHGFKVLAVDTLDALLRMIEEFVCESNEWQSLKDGAYGAGKAAFVSEFRMFVASLERLQRAKGIDLIMLSHASVKKISPPDSDAFDRYDLRCDESVASLLREWATLILFGERYKADKKSPEVLRVRTSCGNAAVAKNRLGLPSTMPLTRTLWTEIEEIRAKDPVELVKKLMEGRDEAEKTLAWFASQADKRHAISVIERRIKETK